MSISGSSWNSLIFTVSDKMLLRFLRSSSTWKHRRAHGPLYDQYQQCNAVALCGCMHCFVPARAAECSASQYPPLRRLRWYGGSVVSIPPESLTTCPPARPETWWPASSPVRSSGEDRGDSSECQCLHIVCLLHRARCISDVKLQLRKGRISCDHGFPQILQEKTSFFWCLLFKPKRET